MTNKKSIAVLIGFCVLLMFSACAQSKKAVKSGSTYAQVILATSQRYLPGVRGAEPQTNYRFVIVWKKSVAPQTFFWRGQDGWMPCEVAKASLASKNVKDNSFPYRVESISLDKIKNGDTLQIMPVNGRAEMPAEILASSANTLFFKTNGKSWLSLPVNNIKQLPKIIGQ